MMELEMNTLKSYYPICLDIEGKRCVIIGGGAIARRKGAALKDHGAEVTVVSPELDSVLEYMAFQKEIEWIEREFQPQDIENAFLVIAATDSRKTNHKVGQLCKEKKILCNVVDKPEESAFINPSTIERGPLIIAISTSGINPSLSASIRQELEIAYGEEYGTFLEMISKFRPMIFEEFPDQNVRTRVYDRILSSRIISLIRSGLVEEAEKELKEIIYNARESERNKR